jgi:hypothetical protein
MQRALKSDVRFAPKATVSHPTAIRRKGPMLSKKSFWVSKQIFVEPLVRSSENKVGGHSISRFSNQRLSRALYEAASFRIAVLPRKGGKNRSVHFLPFSTASTQRRRYPG